MKPVSDIAKLPLLLLAFSSTAGALQLKAGGMVEWNKAEGIGDGYTGVSRSIVGQQDYGARAGFSVAGYHLVFSTRAGWLHRRIEADETPVVASPAPAVRRVHNYDYILWEPEFAIKTEWQAPHIDIGGTLGCEFRNKLQLKANEDARDQAYSWGGYLAWKGVSVRLKKAFFNQGGSYYKEQAHVTMAVGYEGRLASF